jgi:hypothetical protein
LFEFLICRTQPHCSDSAQELWKSIRGHHRSFRDHSAVSDLAPFTGLQLPRSSVPDQVQRHAIRYKPGRYASLLSCGVIN